MRRRWRIILPALGLLAFSAESWYSFQWNREVHHGRYQRYFYWGAHRLDTDPHGKRPQPPSEIKPCAANDQDCMEWDPIYIDVEPGYLERALVFAALPAFLVGAALVGVSERFGINQLVTFMVAMPLLIFAWFYFVGWLLDRWRYKRQQRRSASPS